MPLIRNQIHLTSTERSQRYIVKERLRGDRQRLEDLEVGEGRKTKSKGEGYIKSNSNNGKKCPQQKIKAKEKKENVNEKVNTKR